MRILKQFIICVAIVGVSLIQIALASTASTSVESKPNFRDSRLRYGGNIGGDDDDDPCNIDEGLYSRQLYVVGKSAMRRMAQSNVLLIGMTGLAAEIAKCIVMAGVKNVVLTGDDRNATWEDLSTHWCLREQSVSNGLVKESLPHLQELNPYVRVRQLESSNEMENVSFNAFNVVCCVDQDVATQLRINELARAAGCKFISTSTRGAFGFIFCDFGDEYVVENVDGEDLKTVLVSSVDENGRVRVPIGESHSFSEGDIVELVDGGGCTFHSSVCRVPCPEMGDAEIPNQFTVTRVLGRSSFIINPSPELRDTVNWTGYRLREIKQPKIVKSMSLRMALQSEGNKLKELLCLSPSSSSLGGSNCLKCREFSIHACFLCLDSWRRHHSGRFPTPGCKNDAMAFERMVRECPVTGGFVDEKLVHSFARSARGGLIGVTSLVGGTAAQEVLKACSGLFTPLQQFLYVDCMDALPEPLPTPMDCAARGDRYDGQRAVIGDVAQQALMNRKGFVVGAGAIGCELLKCLALAGFGCHHVGKNDERAEQDSDREECSDILPCRGVTITDMDTIEKSNLNRQFLYRTGDVGRFKSEVAVEAVKRMNPDFVAKALTKCVGGDTDLKPSSSSNRTTPSSKIRRTVKERAMGKMFNKEFWENMDCVFTALDNVASRKFVDSMCVEYRRPLLDSGTLGVKGNTQVVIPGITESYGSSTDPDPDTMEIPLCTLKNFPYEIEHTINWARNLFDGLYRLRPEVANQLISAIGKEEGNEKEVIQTLTEELIAESRWAAYETLRDARIDVGSGVPKSFSDCIAWAKLMFNELFHDSIIQLLKRYPPDCKDEEGEPFWGGSSTRFLPTPIRLDSGDVTHCEFVWWAALLRAEIYRVQVPRSVKAFQQHTLSSTLLDNPPPLALGLNIHQYHHEWMDEDELKKSINAEREELEKLLQCCGKQSPPSHQKLNEAIFDKDGEMNGHVDFITAASNLRAANYGIPPASRFATKKVAGRIVPAIATITTVVSGLISNELLKFCLGRPWFAHRNSFINLAEPCITLWEPVEAGPIIPGSKFTIWDRIEFEGAGLLSIDGLEFLLGETHGVRLIHTITCNGALVYSDELLTRSRSCRRVKKQPIDLLYKKALADEEEELNEDSQSVVVTDPVKESEEHHIDLVIVAEHSNGSVVVLPPVRLHLDSQWRKETGRGQKKNSHSHISPHMFLVSLRNRLKQKWIQHRNGK